MHLLLQVFFVYFSFINSMCIGTYTYIFYSCRDINEVDVFRTLSSAKCSLFGPIFDCTPQPQIKENYQMELLQNLPGYLVVFSNILKYLDSQNLCQLRLTCKQFALMVRQEKIYRNHILTGIENNVNAASIAHLNPFKSWTPDIISQISDSNDLESLELQL